MENVVVSAAVDRYLSRFVDRRCVRRVRRNALTSFAETEWYLSNGPPTLKIIGKHDTLTRRVKLWKYRRCFQSFGMRYIDCSVLLPIGIWMVGGVGGRVNSRWQRFASRRMRRSFPRTNRRLSKRTNVIILFSVRSRCPACCSENAFDLKTVTIRCARYRDRLSLRRTILVVNQLRAHVHRRYRIRILENVDFRLNRPRLSTTPLFNARRRRLQIISWWLFDDDRTPYDRHEYCCFAGEIRFLARRNYRTR